MVIATQEARSIDCDFKLGLETMSRAPLSTASPASPRAGPTTKMNKFNARPMQSPSEARRQNYHGISSLLNLLTKAAETLTVLGYSCVVATKLTFVDFTFIALLLKCCLA
jgi:hypothetical protein